MHYLPTFNTYCTCCDPFLFWPSWDFFFLLHPCEVFVSFFFLNWPPPVVMMSPVWETGTWRCEGCVLWTSGVRLCPRPTADALAGWLEVWFSASGLMERHHCHHLSPPLDPPSPRSAAPGEDRRRWGKGDVGLWKSSEKESKGARWGTRESRACSYPSRPQHHHCHTHCSPSKLLWVFIHFKLFSCGFGRKQEVRESAWLWMIILGKRRQDFNTGRASMLGK